MIFTQKVHPISFIKGNTICSFLPTGDVHQLTHQDILVNQLLGNTVDGSASNIYMRVYEGNEMMVTPLMGVKSPSTFSYSEKQAIWNGFFEGIEYRVKFILESEATWFWKIEVKGSNKEVDFIYAQDLSLANKGATLTNELYMSQYLDHKILEGENGYVICSRQNQNQGGRFPYLQQGSLDTKIIGFSTDAMQFFGKEFKLTNEPVALKGNLENVNYQFELSYTALQTEKLKVADSVNVTFYSIFKPTHDLAVTEIEYLDEIKDVVLTDSTEFTTVEKIKLNKDIKGTFVSPVFTEDELNYYFKDRKMEEIHQGEVISFFTPNHTHVVLQQKELEVERPHGHIITSGISEVEISEGLITSTNYMYGIFNAQVVCGNTTLNKLLSTPRGLLNLFKNSGQRIYIKYNGIYQLLTLPAAYELGVNFAKWFYKVNDDVVIVTSYAAADQADIILEVTSMNNESYEFMVTNQLVMGEQEFNQPVIVEDEGTRIVIKPESGSFLANTYPEIHYAMTVLGATFKLSDDQIFYEDSQTRNGSLMTLTMDPTNHFQLVIQGRLVGSLAEVKEYTLQEEQQKFDALYNRLTCGFKLSKEGNSTSYNLDKLNEIFWWYTHNAMTHYAVPHGLEQPGGAAWGTRDVCQGPFEYFMATQHYELTRNIILEIFSHQFMETGEWPQWFMFDKYNMQQDDSHGDVVFWPLKSLGDYIKATGDRSILSERVVYRHFPHGQITETETVLDHVKRALESIKERFLYGTALISYAGGDWDDTLQPANKALKEKLVSSWTVALAYQTIKQLGEILDQDDVEYAKEMNTMAESIKNVFNELLIKDGVIAGFAYCEDANTIEYMLHPEDTKTGINYRLLPMTRSIISELVSPEQAKRNLRLIDEHLMCPDGVRLMNRPATYKGGVIEFFQRAEQASNVGREIGLQYVHAHIRYIEAMAKLGLSDLAWKGLYTINPINISEQVPNAVMRQSNTYFSSSDGSFNTRYDFQENFEKLRTGDVAVKGGWRIYSSGPGILLNQLVSNILGLRFTANDIILDPVIPQELDGLHFEYMCETKSITFIYRIDGEGKSVEKVEIDGNIIDVTPIQTMYRLAGVSINKTVFTNTIKEGSIITIYMK